MLKMKILEVKDLKTNEEMCTDVMSSNFITNLIFLKLNPNFLIPLITVAEIKHYFD